MLNEILSVIEQSFLHMPLIVGAYVSFSLMKVPDLSIESAYTFGAIAAATIMPHLAGQPLIVQLTVVIVASLFGGLLVGFVSSMLTQYAKLPHLLSSIVTAGLFHGFNILLLGSSIFSLAKFENPLATTSQTLNPEFTTLCVIGSLVIICAYFLFKTQLGFALAVYGNNPQFFGNYGISKKFVFMVGLGIANALAGLSGYCDAQLAGFVDTRMGLTKSLLCLTAIILGRMVIKTTRPFSIAIPTAGVVAYFALQTILLNVGFDLKYFTMIQAIVVLCALTAHYYLKPPTAAQQNDTLGV